MMKSIKTMLVLICSMILLAGCGGISQSDAIKLAKEDAAKIPSPPRLYRGYVTDAAHNDTSMLRYWPDESGSSQSHYNVCGAEPVEPEMKAACIQPITLTTSLASSNSGQDVTFTISWEGDPQSQHSWLFHVSDDGKVNFIREDGDKLPRMPQ